MTDKQFIGLLSPLQKIQATSERTERALNVLNITATEILESSKEVLGELKEQTIILGDIRLLLDDIRESTAKTAGRGKTKPDIKIGAAGGFSLATFMIMTAFGVSGASKFLSGISKVSPAQLLTAIAISVAFIPMIDAFSRIYRTLRPIASTGFLALSMLNANMGTIGKMGKLGKDSIGGGLKSATSTGRMSGTNAVMSSMLIMIGMGVVMMTLSYVFKAMAIPTGKQILTAALIGFALQPMAMVFVTVSLAMRKSGFKPNKKGIKRLLMTGAAMLVTTMAFIGIAYAFRLLPKQIIEPPALDWVINTSLLLYFFSKSFARIAETSKNMDEKQIAKAVLIIPILGLTMVALAYVLNKMPTSIIEGPDIKWVIKTGLLLLVFTKAFVMIARAANKIKFGDILEAAGVMLLVAGLIVGVTYILQYMPDEYKELPSVGYILKLGLISVAMGIPLIILGLIAKSGGGAAALGLGMLAMLLIAVTIVGMAWIFSAMPDDAGAVGANVMDFIMSPVNALVDVLVRFVNEIGVENLLPLAGGILAIAGAFAALSAVSLGASVSGVASAVGNLATSAIDWVSSKVSGEDVRSGPMGILLTLADNAEKLKTLGEPLKAIGTAFEVLVAPGRVIGKFTKFLEVLSDNTFTKQNKNLAKIADSFVKISDASSKMSVEAINATNELFKTISELSSNNTNTMEELGKKIVEAVNSLNKTVDGLDGSVNSFGSKSIEFLKSGIDKFTSKTVESTDQNGNISSEDLTEAIEALRRDINGVLQVQVINASGI